MSADKPAERTRRGPQGEPRRTVAANSSLLGRLIREVRLERGLTQGEVAKELQTNVKRVQAWETDPAEPIAEDRMWVYLWLAKTHGFRLQDHISLIYPDNGVSQMQQRSSPNSPCSPPRPLLCGRPGYERSRGGDHPPHGSAVQTDRQALTRTDRSPAPRDAADRRIDGPDLKKSRVEAALGSDERGGRVQSGTPITAQARTLGMTAPSAQCSGDLVAHGVATGLLGISQLELALLITTGRLCASGGAITRRSLDAYLQGMA